MSVQVAQDEQFTFVAGLNTEASYFTFPKNTWKDGDNLIPNINGRISRRNALDLEDSYVKTTQNISATDKNSWAFVTSKWIAVGGDGDLNFIVAQCGRYVFFYTDTPITTSSEKKSFSIDLNSYKPVSNPSVIGTSPIKCASAAGKLIITSRDTNPLSVEYNASTDTISVTEINIQIRDFEGLDDGLAIDEKPTTLSDEHKYNLFNQGWDQTKINSYFAAKAKYPSNAQSWIYGKDTSDNFDSNVLDKQDFGTSSAPKGRYILDAFNEDRTTASGIAGIATVAEQYRPSVCAFFAGRAWFGGIQSTRLGAAIYFSQVATDVTKYGKCYQDADPTSEVLSDLVDSDGGVVFIQDCGEIVDIITYNNGVVVLASNGVWTIIGTSSNGFSATGYEVQKISSFGCVSWKSVVDVDDAILFWSYSSICKIGRTQVATLGVESLTDLNIKTLYNNIPALARQYSVGTYNPSDKTVYWAYNENLSTNDAEFAYQKTNILALDIRSGAFYTLSFPTSTALPVFTDIVVTKETINEALDFTVVDSSGNTVVDGSGNTVVASLEATYSSKKQFKFLTVIPEAGGTYELTFSDFLNTRDAPSKFYDWYSYDNTGVEQTCYLLTGYNFAPNSPSKFKQSSYCVVFMERTETGFDGSSNPINESSCTLQSRWDFTDNANPNKWDGGQEVYRHKRMFIPSTSAFDDGYPVVITKNKLRGRGRAIQLRFTADPDYDMRILGWSMTVYGGTNV